MEETTEIILSKYPNTFYVIFYWPPFYCFDINIIKK